MTKANITQYDNTAANNTDVQDVPLGENQMYPADVNNAFREIMADLADVNDGTVTLTSPAAGSINITGNITVGGTVDGRDVATDGTKLDGIETGATADQTGSEIATALNGETLTGIASATVTGDLTVDTNTLHVDSTNNRVGIGTSSPAEELTVDGNIQLLGTTYTDFSDYWGVDNNSAFFTPYGYLGSNGSFTVSLYSNGYRNSSGGFTYMGINGNTSTASGIDLHPNGLIQFKTGTASATVLPERMRIESSGDVGIGTTSPASKLHVDGDIRYNGRLLPASTAADGTAGNPAIPVGYDYNTGFFRPAADTIGFSTTGTERMRITSSGRVGIGESNPDGLLHLTGDTNANGAEMYLQVNNNNTTDNLGAIHFGNNVDSTLSRILSGTSGANNSSYLTFSTSNAGTQTERMRIDSSGNVLVGATDTDPAGNNVAGIALRSNGAALISRDGARAADFNRKTSDGDIVAFKKDGTTIGSIGSYSGTGLTLTSGGELRFFTSTSNEDMRLETDGDLHVDGNVVAYSTTISDIRLKKDIAPIEDAVTKVQQLNGCTFTYLKDDRKSAGLIAQDVEKVLPSAVIEDEAVFHGEEGKTYKTVQYDQLIGLLVEAVKELKAEIEELKDASSK